MDWQAEKTLYLQCFAGENQNGGRIDVVGFSCFLRGQPFIGSDVLWRACLRMGSLHEGLGCMWAACMNV